MTYKDIIAPVFGLPEDESALTAAGEIATLFETRAVALIVAVHLASSYADAPSTLSDVLKDIAAGAQSAAALERKEIVTWLQNASHEFEVRDVQVEGAVDQGEAEAQARVADLVIMTHAPEHARARRSFVNRVLFKAGRPVLMVPGAPVQHRQWRRFVVGWNAKAEAMRSVQAALPLLRKAQQVIVATVDAKPGLGGHGPAPGHELAQHLARHGVSVEVRNLDSMGRDTEVALIAEGRAIGADALVLGAYGHSRAQEFMFGGVTRALLNSAPMPLFLCH
ncbi:MAG: universal stress protein [Hyphomonadaceae bacterium]|nr:universal stress protein [Hyphomonadaceae bacterium]